MTDKERFMVHWVPTYGEEKAEELWNLKQERETGYSAAVIADTEGYVSPTTGKWIEGRKARRDDLARSNARPWEGIEAEKQEAARQRAYMEAKQDKRIEEAAWRTWYSMDPKKRRQLMG